MTESIAGHQSPTIYTISSCMPPLTSEGVIIDKLANFSKDAEVGSFFAKNGVLRPIPAAFFWGIQSAEEYCEKKGRRVDQALREQGEAFLQAHPLDSVLLPYDGAGEMYQLAICDGHHRGRLAPKRDVHVLPSYVVGIRTLAQVLSCSPEDLERVLSHETGVAIDSILRKNPRASMPDLLTRVDLERFQLEHLM